MPGMPRTAPWLDTMTIRPLPAARIAGSEFAGEPNRSEEVGGEDLLPRAHRDLLQRAHAGDPGVVHEAERRADGVEDHAGGSRDRVVVVEVELDADQPRVRRTPRPCAARSRSSPSAGERIAATTVQPAPVEMRRRREAEPARRAGDDDAARLSHRRLRTARRPAGASTSGRPSGCALCQPLQMPGKYGPGCPAFS